METCKWGRVVDWTPRQDDTGVKRKKAVALLLNEVGLTCSGSQEVGLTRKPCHARDEHDILPHSARLCSCFMANNCYNIIIRLVYNLCAEVCTYGFPTYGAGCCRRVTQQTVQASCFGTRSKRKITWLGMGQNLQPQHFT